MFSTSESSRPAFVDAESRVRGSSYEGQQPITYSQVSLPSSHRTFSISVKEILPVTKTGELKQSCLH